MDFHHTSDSFLQQDRAKALIHLPTSHLCWIVFNSAISISDCYCIIVRDKHEKFFCQSLALFPSPHYIPDVPRCSLEVCLIWKPHLKTLKHTLAVS